jgi:hypothetical protein
MSIICLFCDGVFVKQSNLNRHYTENRCKVLKHSPQIKIYSRVQFLLSNKPAMDKKIKTVGKPANDSPINSASNPASNHTSTSTQQQFNPISGLNYKYLTPSSIKTMVEKYDTNKNQINLLLTDYIKMILYNKEHPENQAVKCVTKRPPTFRLIVNSNSDDDPKETIVMKSLRDACEMLTPHILTALLRKYSEFVKHYKKPQYANEFDWDLYEEEVDEFRHMLTRQNVYKAVMSVLRFDILFDTNMHMI